MKEHDKTARETRIDDAKAALADAGHAASTRRAAPLVRNLLTEIESAKADGATINEIIESLRSAGFDIKTKTFKTNLYRARKREKTKGSRKENAPAKGAFIAPRATPTTPPAARLGQPQKRDPLQLAPSPKRTFDWDPLERLGPMEFIDRKDDPDKK